MGFRDEFSRKDLKLDQYRWHRMAKVVLLVLVIVYLVLAFTYIDWSLFEKKVMNWYANWRFEYKKVLYDWTIETAYWNTFRSNEEVLKTFYWESIEIPVVEITKLLFNKEMSHRFWWKDLYWETSSWLELLKESEDIKTQVQAYLVNLTLWVNFEVVYDLLKTNTDKAISTSFSHLIKNNLHWRPLYWNMKGSWFLLLISTTIILTLFYTVLTLFIYYKVFIYIVFWSNK